MKPHQWAALEVGDQVRYVGGSDPSRHNTFQVLRIHQGIVYATRVIERRQLGSAGQAVATETVEIRINNDDWQYMRVRPKIALSGGFIVRRADGTEEYDECPTATVPAKPKDGFGKPRVRSEGIR